MGCTIKVFFLVARGVLAFKHVSLFFCFVFPPPHCNTLVLKKEFT